MTRYRTQDGTTFEADTPLSLVEQMRSDSFTPSFDVHNFCSQVASRAQVASGAVVRVAPVEAFVEDCIAEGIVSVVGDDDKQVQKSGADDGLRAEQEANYQRDLLPRNLTRS